MKKNFHRSDHFRHRNADLDGISMCKLALSVNPMVKIILVSAYDKFEYAQAGHTPGRL